MVTSLMYNLLREMKMNVREMHSRKPQLYRTRISDEFRESKQLILVSSDVSSRGMNYPDVTLVVQVCLHILICFPSCFSVIGMLEFFFLFHLLICEGKLTTTETKFLMRLGIVSCWKYEVKGGCF